MLYALTAVAHRITKDKHIAGDDGGVYNELRGRLNSLSERRACMLDQAGKVWEPER